MIGIDAGDIDFIRSSLDRLPRLRQLFSDHPPVRLGSTAETLIGSVWPTFFTGTLPGEHGIYYPMQWDQSKIQLRRVSPDWFSYEPFWYELARQGRRVTVLDPPLVLPSRLEPGIEVIDWGCHDPMGPYESNRPGLTREIHRRYGKHPMGYEIPVDMKPSQLVRICRNLVAGARLKGELSRWILETTEWDFFLTVFGECHRGGHFLWPEPDNDHSKVPRDALLEVYQAVDQAIDHILDGVDLSTTTVILFSLHGMEKNASQEHFVGPVMNRINALFRGEEPSSDNAPAKRRSLMGTLREALPAQLQYWVAKAVSLEVRDWVVARAYAGGLDWSRTPGFTLPADGEGYIRYNLAGREVQGMLEKGSELHRRYEKWLKENFFALKVVGTDAPLVKDIVSPTDLYPGRKSDHLPDLVILWNDLEPATEIYSDRLGRFAGRLGTGRTGNHRPDGFAVLAGDQRRADQVPPLQHIVDFADFVGNSLTQPGNA
jgi:predicted AlkP superfamily phosphohydrolase/phosphomutase